MKTNLRVTVFPRVIGFDNKVLDFDEQCKLVIKIKDQITKHLDHSEFSGVIIQFDEVASEVLEGD